MNYRLLLFLAVISPGAVHAEDWATRDGKSYRDVKVIKVEADAVTILDRDGGALVPLVNLPPALQTRFSYDPAKARRAAAVRAKQDAASAQALQAESAKRKQLQQAKNGGKIARAKSTNVATATASPSDPNHKSRDSLCQGGLPRDRDGDYPFRNDDGKNTSGQSHSVP